VSRVLAAKRDIYSGRDDPLLLQSLAKREGVRETALFVPHLEPGMGAMFTPIVSTKGGAAQ
jgi:hypothetical protein